MSTISFIDDSFAFDGAMMRLQPMGGIQVATIMLAEALAARGHRVTVFNPVEATREINGVIYRPFAERIGVAADLMIVNCAPKLFAHTRARRRVLWMHGPARYLRKPRHLMPLLYHRPHVVFGGDYHRGTWLKWIPLSHGKIIPHGIGAPFIDAPVAHELPPPRVIFTSNPRRGLDWLLDLWVKYIYPQVPEAELHIFAGRKVYGDRPDEKIERALAPVLALADKGVVLREPVGKNDLATELRNARLMLYRGDPGETFCLAAAEAQAMGVPLVTAGVGALRERVTHNVTGFVNPDSNKCAAHAVAILKDRDLWQGLHDACVAQRKNNTWEARAEDWERIFLADLS